MYKFPHSILEFNIWKEKIIEGWNQYRRREISQGHWRVIQRLSKRVQVTLLHIFLLEFDFKAAFKSVCIWLVGPHSWTWRPSYWGPARNGWIRGMVYLNLFSILNGWACIYKAAFLGTAVKFGMRGNQSVMSCITHYYDTSTTFYPSNYSLAMLDEESQNPVRGLFRWGHFPQPGAMKFIFSGLKSEACFFKPIALIDIDSFDTAEVHFFCISFIPKNNIKNSDRKSVNQGIDLLWRDLNKLSFFTFNKIVCLTT